MLNLSKKTEYGLIALTYLSGLAPDQRASVVEIARSTVIPKDLLAKILSELVKAGLAISLSGPTGGFRLAKPASTVSLAEVMRVLERKPGLVDCAGKHGICHRIPVCAIRHPMAGVHKKVNQVLEETMLSDLMTRREGGASVGDSGQPPLTNRAGEITRR
jgi:Rrf2 family protein